MSMRKSEVGISSNNSRYPRGNDKSKSVKNCSSCSRFATKKRHPARRISSKSCWLDGRRLIFWDVVREKAFLWDTVDQKAKEIEDLQGPAEYVFSEDGKTIFILRPNELSK